MSIVETWAQAHGIPAAALADLRARLAQPPTAATAAGDKSEAVVLQDVRATAARAGVILWRNNVGAGSLQNGSYVRWGLANDSAAVNRRLKSSDLIGIRPVTITPDQVGSTIGQFVAREVKAGGWRFTNTGREVAQNNFLTLVKTYGGDGEFTTGEWR